MNQGNNNNASTMVKTANRKWICKG